MSSTHTLHTAYFATGNQALLEHDPVAAIQHYIDGAVQLNSLHGQFEGNLDRARRAYRRQRKGAAPRLAVCGWSMSHNPAGRVMALADAYRPRLACGQLAALEVVGALFPRWGEKVWGPMSEFDLPCHILRVEEDVNFVALALKFVAQHPYDIVHLSKPRFPNLVFGLLYRLVWDAHVVWDIDDEELAFAGDAEPLTLATALELRPSLAVEEPLHKPFWTQLSVGEVGRFPVVSVSNPALQQRYGGECLPHVRNEHHFVPSLGKRQAARKRFAIPHHAKVVLFMGTPRAHKGLLETAQGLASLALDNVWMVIAGNFANDKASKQLKQALQAINGIHLCFLDDQPFSTLPDVLALGDYCVLLQDADTQVARYQLPAKLMDALAMGLIVLARVTPATQWLADQGAITPVTLENFPTVMKKQLSVDNEQPQREWNRNVFEQHLSVGAVQPRIEHWLNQLPAKPPAPSWQGRLASLLKGQLPTLLC